MSVAFYFTFCIQNNSFKKNYETDITFADDIHKSLALAFLEPNPIVNGFEYIMFGSR